VLRSWIVEKDGQKYAWDGEKGTPEVQALMDEWDGREYVARIGLVCGPTYTPNMVLELATDLLIGNYDDVIEWEDDDEPEPGTPGDGNIPSDAVT
jgi:hypothetical protein